jgi:hypothetical protein
MNTVYTHNHPSNPDKARACADGRVPRNEREVRAAIRALEDCNARATRVRARDEVLVVRPADLHAADLVEAGVDVRNDGERLGRVVELQDRDRVAARVERARVPVRRVQVRRRERRVGRGEEQLRRGHRRAGRRVRRYNRDGGRDRARAAVGRRKRLRGERARELVQDEERAAVDLHVAGAGAGRLRDAPDDAVLARARRLQAPDHVRAEVRHEHLAVVLKRLVRVRRVPLEGERGRARGGEVQAGRVGRDDHPVSAVVLQTELSMI